MCDPLAMDDFLYQNEEHRSCILDEMKSMYDEQLLVDVEICVEDKTFFCHRNVLAAASPFFKALLTTQLRESQANVVHLREVDVTSVMLIIEYAYTGSVRITKANAQNLLVAASLYQFLTVLEACGRFMETQLDVSNCIGIYYFAAIHNCSELKIKALEYIEKHFISVSKGEEFLSLDATKIGEILSSNELNVEKEELVFDSLLRWVACEESRLEHLGTLLLNIRFGLLSSRFIQEHVFSNKIISFSPHCQQLLNDLQSFEMHPNKYCGMSKFLTILRTGMIKPDQCILFVGGVDRWRHPYINCYNPLTRETYYTSDICDENRSGFYSVENPACIVTDDNQIYMAGGNYIFHEVVDPDGYYIDSPYDEDSFDEFEEETVRRNFYLYDSDHNRWVARASMLFPKSNFALAYLSGKIYCFGGLSINQHPSEIIECYDVQSNQWKYVGMMPTTVVDLAVVAFNNHIYMIGGRSGSEMKNVVMRCDPKSAAWTTLAGMPTPRFKFGACVVDNEIYVIGGKVYAHTGHIVGRDALTSVDIYSIANNQWRRGPDLPTAIYNVGAFQINGVLYACGMVEHHRTTFRIYRCNAIFKLDQAQATWHQIEADLCNVRDYACIAAKMHTRRLPQIFRPEVDT